MWYSRPEARAWRCACPPSGARAFHAALPGYAPTPLVEIPALAAELGVARLLVKDESQRFDLAAFKALGVSWAVDRLLAERAAAGRPGPITLVSATDGNHGRALARTARLLGLPARIVVPHSMTAGAEALLTAEGAMVERVAGGYDDAVVTAAALVCEPEAALVQDMAWPGYERVPGWIVEGYATLVAEVDEEMAVRGIAGPELVVIPVGVGSLAQAAIAHYRDAAWVQAHGEVSPALLAVEPAAAACALAGLRAGRPVSTPTGDTIMAGLNCESVSGAAWPYLSDGLDAAVAVRDDAAARAVADLAAAGISSGPSGAAALAGARAALTGRSVDGVPTDERRAALGVGPASVVVLLSTEGRKEIW